MKTTAISFLLVALSASGCTSQAQSVRHAAPRPASSLSEAFEGHFLMGTALNTAQIFEKNAAETSLITSQFSSIVAENCMKSESIHPEQERFFWTEADAFVSFGEKHDMHIQGHTLAWHSQAPAWLFVDAQGNEVSREVLLDRMQTHITTLLQRYQGRVVGWDVVNEAVLDDGSLRDSAFLRIIGPDWVEHMFRFAQAADPSAKLFYNDYSTWKPEKREGIYRLVKGLQDKGVRVDGVGMQGHMGLHTPTVGAFEEALVRLSELGEVMITELDISTLPRPGKDVSAEVSLSVAYQEEMNPFRQGLPESVAQRLNHRFVEMFELFLRHRASISRVTTWGVTDASSWRNDWPMKGRVDYPLLFNRDRSPKPAVARLIALAHN